MERDGQATGRLGRQATYAELVKAGTIPDELLDATTRKRLASLKADDSLPSPPNALDMAVAADKRWMGEFDLIGRYPFAMVYFLVFTGPSFVSHPSVTAVSRVVHGTPPDLNVGHVEQLGDSTAPYGVALMAFANMLLVSGKVLGWPDESAVRGVLARG